MPDAELRAFFVWVPMKPSDSEAAAQSASERFSETRAMPYWDRGRHFSRRMARELRIDSRRSIAPDDEPAFAWDVYLTYGRGNTGIEQPDFWMHQLAVEHAPRFEADKWRRRVQALIEGGA
jgi:hypothetical protein